MRRFERSRRCLGAALTVQVLQLEQGVHVSVFGGQLPHIGAVSIVSPEGACSTVQFPGHKDGAVSRRWAEALAAAGYRPAVVEAGIHYDGLSREGIETVLSQTDAMLEETLEALSAAGTP